MAELLQPKELLLMASDAEQAEMEKERQLKQKKQQQDLDLRDAFMKHHGDLLDPAFWQAHKERIAAGRLIVVGAEYSLETGVVDFFDV